MANRTIYTRAYSTDSPRQLVSDEIPKAPEDILIVFIEVPHTEDATSTRIHDARVLAEESNLADAERFRYEKLFEWEIPETCVLHRVSLQTLLERGIEERFGLGEYLDSEQQLPFPSTRALKDRISNNLRWELGVGLYLGFFAKTFGARAPLGWIAHQLFVDCRPRWISLSTYDDWDEELDLVLIDWWLTSDEFVMSVKMWEMEKKATEDRMMDSEIELWEKWHEPGCRRDSCVECISEEDMREYEMERDKLDALEKVYRAEFEKEAIRLGL
ncbi:hypothetical protein DL546_005833 [Coniochaeta pulveracea]|uniref:Uncharacterized protein n=1 Tax=Coniochaeta pulveracea TaxID=177199 RepID=A0A420YLP0_9PEZI|nr:hypothetical protein DL546_005833 [Coniochaeta pulveracea]